MKKKIFLATAIIGALVAANVQNASAQDHHPMPHHPHHAPMHHHHAPPPPPHHPHHGHPAPHDQMQPEHH